MVRASESASGDISISTYSFNQDRQTFISNTLIEPHGQTRGTTLVSPNGLATETTCVLPPPVRNRIHPGVMPWVGCGRCKRILKKSWMSSIPYFSMAIRSIPMPKAKPE